MQGAKCKGVIIRVDRKNSFFEIALPTGRNDGQMVSK